MQTIHRQRGMTFLGLVLILVVLGSVLLVGLKLFPVYKESFVVDGALNSLISQPGIENKSRRDIYKQFLKYMEIEDIDRFSDANIAKFLKVEKKGNGITLSLEYQAQAPLFKNLSIVADWKKLVSK